MKPSWLVNLPLPPSVNDSLIPIPVRKWHKIKNKWYWGAEMRPSPSMVAFKKQIEEYRLGREEGLSALSKYLMHHVEKGMVLRVDCFFAFHEDRVFSNPNKKILQLDGNNRIKPLLDGVVKLLGIDDCMYFRGDCEKVTTAQKEFECTMVRIQPLRHRTLAEIRDLIAIETSIRR